MGLSAHFRGGTGPLPHPASQFRILALGGWVEERAGNGVFKPTPTEIGHGRSGPYRRRARAVSDTVHGMDAFDIADPDGNVIRFGRDIEQALSTATRPAT